MKKPETRFEWLDVYAAADMVRGFELGRRAASEFLSKRAGQEFAMHRDEKADFFRGAAAEVLKVPDMEGPPAEYVDGAVRVLDADDTEADDPREGC